MQELHARSHELLLCLRLSSLFLFFSYTSFRRAYDAHVHVVLYLSLPRSEKRERRERKTESTGRGGLTDSLVCLVLFFPTDPQVCVAIRSVPLSSVLDPPSHACTRVRARLRRFEERSKRERKGSVYTRTSLLFFFLSPLWLILA